MTRLQELEQQALALTDAERALFASHLLGTLPAILHDDDAGVGEAMRRERDFEEHLETRLSWDDIKKGLGR